MNEFIRRVLRVNSPRVHRIRNSRGVYDAYKYLRKNKWKDIGRPVTEHEFYTVIRSVNKLLAKELLNGNDIHFPHRMGTLEIRKYDAMVSVVDGKVVTNLPVDWHRTLELWSEDEEAYVDRILVRVEEKEIFKIFYNRKSANYENKSFMQFEPNRNLKRELKQRIKDRTIDAFKL